MELRNGYVKTKEQLIRAKNYRQPNIHLEYECLGLKIKEKPKGGK